MVSGVPGAFRIGATVVRPVQPAKIFQLFKEVDRLRGMAQEFSVAADYNLRTRVMRAVGL